MPLARRKALGPFEFVANSWMNISFIAWTRLSYPCVNGAAIKALGRWAVTIATSGASTATDREHELPMKSPRVVSAQDSIPTQQPPNSRQNESPTSADVLRSMPRRPISHSIKELQVALPRARRVVFKANVFRAISRLFVWLWGFLRFYSGNIFDSLRGRGSVQSRALRLRRAFSRAARRQLRIEFGFSSSNVRNWMTLC